MRMTVRKFFGLFWMLALSMLVLGVIATLALGVFTIVVSTDLAGMQAWIEDRETPLAALRTILYAAIIWIAPIRMQTPAKLRIKVRTQLAVGFLIVDALVIHQVWRYF